MKMIQITPGSGGTFYCENCLRDSALVRAMRQAGHDVVLVPMYLPLELNSPELATEVPIFFGGLNVYLQQTSALFRRSPRWFDRMLDSRGLLARLGRLAGMTKPSTLAEMTLSMLQGTEGRQVKELDRLLDWLAWQADETDVICLSNALLAGLAGPIRSRLHRPVVCFLQDEDGFLDGLGEPYSAQAWNLLRQKVRDIDGFITISDYYAGVMRQRLDLPESKVKTVYMGMDTAGYEPAATAPLQPTIGFLSRLCEGKGLAILFDAFAILKKDPQLANLRLRLAGGKTREDVPFLDEQMKKLAAAGLDGAVEFLPVFDRPARIAFLQDLSVLTVPEIRPASYGLYLLEALACGVPVVQPWEGVFGELLEFTGGGALYQPNQPENLAEALKPLLLDPAKARELGGWGRQTVLARFNLEQTAADLGKAIVELIRPNPN